MNKRGTREGATPVKAMDYDRLNNLWALFCDNDEYVTSIEFWNSEMLGNALQNEENINVLSEWLSSIQDTENAFDWARNPFSLSVVAFYKRPDGALRYPNCTMTRDSSNGTYALYFGENRDRRVYPRIITFLEMLPDPAHHQSQITALLSRTTLIHIQILYNHLAEMASGPMAWGDGLLNNIGFQSIQYDVISGWIGKGAVLVDSKNLFQFSPKEDVAWSMDKNLQYLCSLYASWQAVIIETDIKNSIQIAPLSKFQPAYNQLYSLAIEQSKSIYDKILFEMKKPKWNIGYMISAGDIIKHMYLRNEHRIAGEQDVYSLVTFQDKHRIFFESCKDKVEFISV